MRNFTFGLMALMFSSAASANVSIRLNRPQPTWTNSGSVTNLTLTEGKPSVSFRDPAPKVLNLACGLENGERVATLVVTVNGEVTMIGRTRNCVATLSELAAKPAQFALTVGISSQDPEKFPNPHLEIQASGQ